MDAKQSRLNEAVERDVKAAGGHNFIQACYLKGLCRAVITCDTDKFDEIQPDVNESTDRAWIAATKLVMAFLRRYKMDTTLATLKMEHPGAPRSLGFARANDVDKAFEDLLGRRKST